MAEYPCQLASVPVDYRKIGNGLIFQKDWPYTRLFNKHLNEVLERGIEIVQNRRIVGGVTNCAAVSSTFLSFCMSSFVIVTSFRKLLMPNNLD